MTGASRKTFLPALASIWYDLGRKPVEHFPNRLRQALVDEHGEAHQRPAESDRARLAVVPACGLLAILVLVCLVLRAWMAWRWDIIWPDTVAYFEAAKALEQGDRDPLVVQFGLNIYPFILLLLHRAGLGWELAGQWWSLAMASLTVLPLWGWLRRQFDGQVATVGCLLYAVHPRLMNSSPLIIRDSTFWFLFALTLYLAWRAALEVRPGLFAAAGIAWGLALHTRTEGWLLLVPVALWFVMRWRVVAGRRLRLAPAACSSWPPCRCWLCC